MEGRGFRAALLLLVAAFSLAEGGSRKHRHGGPGGGGGTMWAKGRRSLRFCLSFSDVTGDEHGSS